ncbi:hypothetical protein ACFWRV_09590 [Streptomyces sp. NPDC058576]|uniref:hypothetical protein n=1 Tax=Streptomyces sp. NPDC058576 TaxID=3346547 RepID=UPI00365372C2
MFSISPTSVIPGPSAPQVHCRYAENRRRQNVSNHMACLRGDLLSTDLDFAYPFPEDLRKIVNGETVTVVEYELSRMPYPAL